MTDKRSMSESGIYRSTLTNFQDTFLTEQNDKLEEIWTWAARVHCKDEQDRETDVERTRWIRKSVKERSSGQTVPTRHLSAVICQFETLNDEPALKRMGNVKVIAVRALKIVHPGAALLKYSQQSWRCTQFQRSKQLAMIVNILNNYENNQILDCKVSMV